MKKLVLSALLSLTLSICSTSAKADKPVVTKQELIKSWVCVTNYDDLKMTSLDIFDFKVNGEMKNVGSITNKNFEPLIFTYKTEDQGYWELKGNQLVIDYDLSKRKVTKTTPQKLLSLLKQDKYRDLGLDNYEQDIFNILSNNQDEDSKIQLDILKFGNSEMSIEQRTDDKVYSGDCVAAEKAQEHLKNMAN